MSYPRGAYLASVPEEDRTVLEQALEWLQEEYACDEVIPGPVSLLQNHFRIGYGQGLRVAHHLERLQIWKMQDDLEHGRIAMI